MEESQYRGLTPTERDVLRRLGQGSRPGEIAAQLDRSVSTINNHLHAARAKLLVTDSLTAARALLAFEESRQSLPRQELPVATDRQNTATEGPQAPGGEPATVLREERSLFGHAPLVVQPIATGPAGGWQDVHVRSRGRKIAVVLCITLLLLACIALAPAMATTFQLIIDRLYPIPQ